jgi:hypothetical protein
MEHNELVQLTLSKNKTYISNEAKLVVLYDKMNRFGDYMRDELHALRMLKMNLTRAEYKVSPERKESIRMYKACKKTFYNLLDEALYLENICGDMAEMYHDCM